MDNSWTIAPAQPDQRTAGLTLAFAHLPGEESPRRVAHVLDLIAAGEFDPFGLWIAHRHDAIEGVFVCRPMPGAVGQVWPPRGNPHSFSVLVAAGLDWLRERNVKLVQATLPIEDAEAIVPLARHGFIPAGPMRFFKHDLQELPPSPFGSVVNSSDRATLPRLTPFSETDPALFAATLEQTYEGTLDFAEISNLRTIDEVLTGYRANPLHRPENWYLATVNGDAAGVLMLAELERLEGWDLSYVGVVPRHRRKGVGRALVAAALRLVADAAGSHLEVAVDSRNRPAVQLYAELNFQLASEQLVSLIFLRPGG